MDAVTPSPCSEYHRDAFLGDLRGALLCGDDSVRGYMTAAYLHFIADTLQIDAEPMLNMDEMADRIRYVLDHMSTVGVGR